MIDWIRCSDKKPELEKDMLSRDIYNQIHFGRVVDAKEIFDAKEIPSTDIFLINNTRQYIFMHTVTHYAEINLPEDL